MLVTLASTAHPEVRQEFAVSFAGRLEQELRAAGVVVHRLPSPRASRPLMIWRARRAFMAMQAKAAPDVTIFHSAWPHAMFAGTARAGGARLCFWQHQPITTPAWPDRWARFVRPDVAVFNSRFTEARPAFPAVPGRVIHCAVAGPPAVSPDERRSLRASLGAGDDHVVVLMAARFERWKGHEVLLKSGEAPAGVHADSHLDCRRQPGVRLPVRERAGRRRIGARRPGVDARRTRRCSDLDAARRRLLPAESERGAVRYRDRRGDACGVAVRGVGRRRRRRAPGRVLRRDRRSGDAEGIADALRRLAADPEARRAIGEAAERRASELTDPAGRIRELFDVLSCPQPS